LERVERVVPDVQDILAGGDYVARLDEKDVWSVGRGQKAIVTLVQPLPPLPVGRGLGLRHDLERLRALPVEAPVDEPVDENRPVVGIQEVREPVRKNGLGLARTEVGEKYRLLYRLELELNADLRQVGAELLRETVNRQRGIVRSRGPRECHTCARQPRLFHEALCRGC